MTTTHNPFKQMNGFSMQNGLIVGIWVLAAQYAMVLSFNYSILSLVSAIMLLFTPILIFILSKGFRNAVATQGYFTLTQGFLHTFLTMFYASVWVALGVFVYFAYIDKGYVFDAYLEYLKRPEMQELLAQKEFNEQITASLQGMTIEEAIENLRFVSPANFAGMIFYTNLMVSPIMSLLIAIFLRKNK